MYLHLGLNGREINKQSLFIQATQALCDPTEGTSYGSS